jgi:hypothetical protein
MGALKLTGDAQVGEPKGLYYVEPTTRWGLHNATLISFRNEPPPQLKSPPFTAIFLNILRGLRSNPADAGIHCCPKLFLLRNWLRLARAPHPRPAPGRAVGRPERTHS